MWWQRQKWTARGRQKPLITLLDSQVCRQLPNYWPSIMANTSYAMLSHYTWCTISHCYLNVNYTECHHFGSVACFILIVLIYLHFKATVLRQEKYIAEMCFFVCVFLYIYIYLLQSLVIWIRWANYFKVTCDVIYKREIDLIMRVGWNAIYKGKSTWTRASVRFILMASSSLVNTSG